MFTKKINKGEPSNAQPSNCANHLFSLYRTLSNYERSLVKVPTHSVTSLNTQNSHGVIFVRRGSGSIIIKGDVQLIKVDDLVRVPRNSLSSLANILDIELEVLYFRYFS